MNIEVIGAEFNNKGAELMLVAVCQQLQQKFQLTPLMAPSLFAPYEKRAAMGMRQVLRLQAGQKDFSALLKFIPRFMFQRLAHFGIVPESQIDIVLDASGFAYGETWSLSRLQQAAAIAKRIKQQGGKYILLPQAFGPFQSPEYIDAARVLFDNSALVFARDLVSMAAVKAVASHVNVHLSPDFTALVAGNAPHKHREIQLEGSKQGAKTSAPSVFCLIPNTNMQKVVTKAEYLEFLVALAKFFDERNFAIQIMNHEGAADKEICLMLQSQLNELQLVAELIEPQTAQEVKDIIKQAQWVFSSRFHGCVSALSQGIPALATSWSHKYEALYDDYQLPQYLLDVAQSESSLHQNLTDILSRREHDSSTQTARISQIKAQIVQMWELVFDVCCLK